MKTFPNQKNDCNGSRGLPSGPMLAPDWQDLFVAAYRETLSITRAASAAGIARRTYYKYIQTDPDFAAKVKEAMEDAKDDLRETIFQRAKFGTPQVRKSYDSKGNLIAETTTVMHETHLAVRAAEAYLPEFKPKSTVEMSGPNSGAIAVDVTEQKRVAITMMAQQLLDNGWDLKLALSHIIELGIPAADVRLVRGDDLRLPPQDESGKK